MSPSQQYLPEKETPVPSKLKSIEDVTRIEQMKEALKIPLPPLSS